MNRTAMSAAIAAIALGIGGCVAAPHDASPGVDAASHDRTIEGTVTYRERIALPPGSTLDVRLIDISRADAPATVLASDTRVLNGEQVPLGFRLHVDGQDLQSTNRYAVRATIRDADGALMWTTDSVHPVDPVAARQDLGPLLMGHKLPRRRCRGASIWWRMSTARA